MPPDENARPAGCLSDNPSNSMAIDLVASASEGHLTVTTYVHVSTRNARSRFSFAQDPSANQA
jgi:hypothetical protein